MICDVVNIYSLQRAWLAAIKMSLDQYFRLLLDYPGDILILYNIPTNEPCRAFDVQTTHNLFMPQFLYINDISPNKVAKVSKRQLWYLFSASIINIMNPSFQVLMD